MMREGCTGGLTPSPLELISTTSPMNGHIVLDFYFFFMALHLLGRFRLPLPLFEHISKSSHHCHRSEHQCTWRFSWLGCPFV